MPERGDTSEAAKARAALAADKPGKPHKEGRLARHARQARTVWEDPRALGGIVREGLIGIWSSRGGGFYGLGYLLAFVIMEVRMVVGEFEESAGFFEFVSNQLLEYLFRVGIMSLVNVLLALMWPVLLLEHLGGWGLVILPVAYVVFERLLRPGIEASVPELGEARRRKQLRKEQKQRRKEQKRNGQGAGPADQAGTSAPNGNQADASEQDGDHTGR